MRHNYTGRVLGSRDIDNEVFGYMSWMKSPPSIATRTFSYMYPKGLVDDQAAAKSEMVNHLSSTRQAFAFP
jgi:hypothetical protein